MNFRLAALCFALPVFFVPYSHAETPNLYQDPRAPLEARVKDLFDRLTLDEKITLLNGTAYTTQPVARLGIPPMEMVDSGEGVLGGTKGTSGPATQFPSAVAMASTWDPALIGRVGAAIGVEVRNKGTGASVLLGPPVNIQRSPLGGRNGEYFTEDPYLNARLAVAYIEEMQKTGTAACIKHYACNNEEGDRGTVNVNVSPRALCEIYLPAFEAAVKEAHVESLMAAYNKLNGPYMTANRRLLTDVLKRGWGFDGAVISDWGALHEPAAVAAGTDLEMPGPRVLVPSRVRAALKEGALTEADIDAAVTRLLRLMIRVRLLDGPVPAPDPSLVNSPEHQKLAYQVAAEGMVLLKNERGVLPLDRSRVHSIALVGHGARGLVTAAGVGGNDRPAVDGFYAISPEQGLRALVGSEVALNVVDPANTDVVVPSSALVPADNPSGHGLRAEYFSNKNLDGSPDLIRTDETVEFNHHGNDQSVRWTGKLLAARTGSYELTLRTDNGTRLYLDNQLVINAWAPVVDPGVLADSYHSAFVKLVAGQSYDLRIECFQVGQAAKARFGWLLRDDQAEIDAARQADAAIVFVTTRGAEGEAHDRPSFELPHQQDELIRGVAAVNKNTVVVLNNGTPVSCKDWIDQVPAIVEAWFPGQEAGKALAAILFGKVNPSGKLPTTLGVNREDYPDYPNFPGTNGEVNYAEGIFVGYRHFDQAKIAPYFPFGHGLSYTTFVYSDLKLAKPEFQPGEPIQASISVTNTGRRAGEEIAQVYIHDPDPKIEKPVRELKGFARVALAPDESKTVTFELPPRSLASCDAEGKQWKADAGKYEIEVGASSRDIRQKAAFQLTGTFSEPILFLAK